MAILLVANGGDLPAQADRTFLCGSGLRGRYGGAGSVEGQGRRHALPDQWLHHVAAGRFDLSP